MFRIPKKIKIGAYEYNIVVKDNLEHNKKKLFGLCDNSNFEIILDSTLKGVEKEVVFLHECLHAIEYCHEIKLGERKISKLDHALIAFMRDNKIRF